MKKMLVALLITVFAAAAFASAYSFDEAVICGNKVGTDDTTFVNAPDYSHPYGVAVAGNGRVFSASYYSVQRYDAAIMVYDPEIGILDTIGPEIIGADGVTADTLGYCRFMKTLPDGNVAFGDWKNDKIRVFDMDDYSVVAESPGPDDGVYPNVGGGITAFAYDDEVYYLSQQIVGSTVVLWDADFNVVDTLTGGPGGRNLAATPDGSKIISPSLGGQYFIEWAGNPDDGYVSDTVWLADLDQEIGNIMYVSAGPNDYFWLFSRDAANDGVLVCDPENNYAVKLFTNTDSTVTPTTGFDLGMVMDNQAKIWLAQGLIDSSEWVTTLGYNQPYMLRAPCQVAYDWDGTTESLYLADYYGYTLKKFTRTTETSVWEHTGYIGENGFELKIAYPNPFNPSVTIPYVLSANGNVQIDMYDIAGKKVASMVNEYKLAGNYNVHFDASNLSSGNYIVKMTFANKTVSQKVALVK
ncbi:MAG: T9SS type A sorting domain-containing protein [Clostridiales bacterium]|nr:T9SS type A sorting domain-containing protein [Clostridiales bacterium]RKY52699.1 MAG: hypothetical protein DRP93_07710 [Candidatus Neomarinimicrobiota bacterium]